MMFVRKKNFRRLVVAVIVGVTLCFLLLSATVFHQAKDSEMKIRRTDPGGDGEVGNDMTYLADIGRVFDGLHTPGKRSKLPVFVVEEHHEVIPYWFTAANRGLIPKKGITLVHFDGHADLSLTRVIDGYPMFRWPLDHEFPYLMQQNDVFIQTAAMAGLINRVIWIWPHWDREQQNGNYTMTVLKIGTYTAGEGEKAITDFCMCSSVFKATSCFTFKDYETDDINQYQTVSQDECFIQKKIIVEEIHELTAAAMLLKDKLLVNNEDVILDIDEDYYGCIYAVEPLLNANISLFVVKAISDYIGKIFCPRTTNSEKISEELLFKITDNFIVKKKCQAKSGTNCDVKHLTSAEAVYQFLTDHNNEDNFIMCPGTTKEIAVAIKKLLSYFEKRSVTQLEVLKKVGFCSDTTPKTVMVRNPVFGLCTGANDPENTVVYRHQPTLSEIHKRTVLLNTVLRQLRRTWPRLVTVCRSVRDGYTPRQFFSQIEGDVMSAIHRAFGGADNVTIHYDDDLIGGPLGWPLRDRK